MNFYITTPIYYTNDIPHIGHAYTTIACDILARFNKLSNNDVFFLSGTDEHGQKVEKAAKVAEIDTKIFVDKLSLNFKKLIPFLGCEIDDFIRTTEERHIKSAQALWNKLIDNDQIYLSTYEGWYSVRDEAFYHENELKKTDGKLVTDNGSPVEWVKEESYFFKLSNWEKKLIEFYENNPDNISPKSRYNEVLSFIKSGLKDLSISRTTFKWGVPVPNNNKHVMYVWIDALCNYLSAIGYPDKNNLNYKKYWPATHIVGKDILRFHAVYWPAFLMAAELEPPKKIFAHGWWTNEGQKISKSLGNVIDPYDIIHDYGLDQIRFFLFREVPFGNDGDFSKKAISKRVNADLSNNYGNLIQRILTFIVKNCNSSLKSTNNFSNQDNDLLNILNLKFKDYSNYMNNQQIDKSIKSIMELLSSTNAYVDEQAPWSLKKTDQERMKVVLFLVSIIIIKSTLMLFPIIPKSSKKVLSFFNLDTNNLTFDKYDDIIKKDININVPDPIFPRID
ncbi:MAG: methionine--tRNA ligase [Pelagibacteraceae bacterium TMED237]|nr:MAG: methionine--tRNA ligase [Pelagibacteraceae bacterium TMED237]